MEHWSRQQGLAYPVDPPGDPERWEYRSHAEDTVEATPWDLAGNQTTALSWRKFYGNATLSLPQIYGSLFQSMDNGGHIRGQASSLQRR